MNPAYKLLAGLLMLAGVFGAGFGAGHHIEAQSATAKLSAVQVADAKAIAQQQADLAKANADALAKQQQAEQHLAVIQQTYEEDKAHAQAQYDSNLARLRAGTLRLRNEWTTCTPQLSAAVSKAASGGPVPDAATQLRYQDASDLVRNADDADAEIRALQRIVTQDRQ